MTYLLIAIAVAAVVASVALLLAPDGPDLDLDE